MNQQNTSEFSHSRGREGCGLRASVRELERLSREPKSQREKEKEAKSKMKLGFQPFTAWGWERAAGWGHEGN